MRLWKWKSEGHIKVLISYLLYAKVDDARTIGLPDDWQDCRR